MVCVLALDSVRLGVDRSGVRALAVVVGVGEVVSLIGLRDETDADACKFEYDDTLGESTTDQGSEEV